MYGCPPLSDEEKEEAEKQLYEYLKALILTERINPEPDYDDERERFLLKKIALSNLSLHLRDLLVMLLENDQQL